MRRGALGEQAVDDPPLTPVAARSPASRSRAASERKPSTTASASRSSTAGHGDGSALSMRFVRATAPASSSATAARHLVRVRLELLVGHDARHQPDAQRQLGVDHRAEQRDLARPAVADEPRQQHVEPFVIVIAHFGSGHAKRADVAATRTSQFTASSSPPP